MDTPAPVIDGVSSQDQLAPSPAGAPDVAIRIFQPTERSTNLPALLWIHGGGYVLGEMAGDDVFAKQLVRDVECVVVTVEYRLAPGPVPRRARRLLRGPHLAGRPCR